MGRDGMGQNQKTPHQTNPKMIFFLMLIILNIWIKINTSASSRNKKSMYFFIRKGTLKISPSLFETQHMEIVLWVAEWLKCSVFGPSKVQISKELLLPIIHKKIKFTCENTQLTVQDQKTDVIISQLLQSKHGLPYNF